MLTAVDTGFLHDLAFDHVYLLLTERELFNFEMINYYIGERWEYMVRFPKKHESFHDFSTFYDERLIVEKDGTVKIGNEDNFRSFNGYVYSPKEYTVLFSSEPLPPRIFIIDPAMENILFTEMYIYDAEEFHDIELVKEVKKVKLFKVWRESEYDEWKS
jgi:hypothetical protein